MRLITNTRLHKIVADEGKHIRSKNDVYVPAHYDEDGNFVDEHFPYYAKLIYVPKSFTEQKMYDLYVEEPIE